MTDTFAAGKESHLSPRFRQQDSRTQDQKHQPHDGKERDDAFLSEPPTSLRKVLKHPVVAQADHKQVRHVLRRDHRTVRSRRGPVVLVRTAISTFGDALPAQPKDVGQQEKENEKSIFFGDTVETYGARIESPQRRRNQSDFNSEEL